MAKSKRRNRWRFWWQRPAIRRSISEDPVLVDFWHEIDLRSTHKKAWDRWRASNRKKFQRRTLDMFLEGIISSPTEREYLPVGRGSGRSTVALKRAIRLSDHLRTVIFVCHNYDVVSYFYSMLNQIASTKQASRIKFITMDKMLDGGAAGFGKGTGLVFDHWAVEHQISTQANKIRFMTALHSLWQFTL